MVIVHGFLLVCALTIVSRMMELQLIDRKFYYDQAQDQQLRGIKLPALRGEVFALNGKTHETSILATNTTLDLLYVDPLITQDPSRIADTLVPLLITEDVYRKCAGGADDCPRELITFPGSPFSSQYDPLAFVHRLSSGSLLEPLPNVLPTMNSDAKVPDITEVRRLFARDIERRISKKRVTFVPLKYSATKIEIKKVRELNLPGVDINEPQKMIFANPEETPQSNLTSISRSLAPVLNIDATKILPSLRSRPLRYVPILRRLSPQTTLRIKEKLLQSLTETNRKRAQARTREEADTIQDPLRSIALLPEHWRFYPDDTIASQVVGFMNTNQEAQYGVERTFDAQLRGQEGLISTVSDLQGGQILTSNQTIINPRDGDSIVLTIDPFVQKEVERLLQEGLQKYDAESGQVVVMDPFTGHVIAMANAPLFRRNRYASVYEKVPLNLPPDREKTIVVEIYNPQTNARIVKGYLPQIFSDEDRAKLPDKIQKSLAEVQQQFDLKDLARYYLYFGENTRQEIFPTSLKGIWLKYKNNIGVGAYLNRSVQEIYEPGSVMKPITMAIALDQGEVTPDLIYDDKGPVEVDTYTIKNALLKYYGKVTMTNCLEFSINTCMTTVSGRLGKKLFHHMIERFGFGHVTGIELDDELTGELKPWRSWSKTLLATAAFGQGISATPLQMITAFSALANGGKLMRPTIIDSVIHPDGTIEKKEPVIIDQIIKPETSDTITAMLVSSTNNGFAKRGKVKGYTVAGKTGTSQIAGPGGRYETGTGSTIGTYMGYAPATHPKFVVLVKFDRPKRSLVVYGESTAGPLFHDIAEFLFKYYGIPPDEK